MNSSYAFNLIIHLVAMSLYLCHEHLVRDVNVSFSSNIPFPGILLRVLRGGNCLSVSMWEMRLQDED